MNQLNCFNLIFRRNSFIRHLIQDFVKGFFAIDLNFYLKDITMVQRSELHVMSEPWLASLTIIMSYIMSRLLSVLPSLSVIVKPHTSYLIPHTQLARISAWK